MVPAKKFGVKVTDYAIGFGPTVFKRQRGETVYHLKLIPLGGFIRMIGMYAPSRADGKVVGGRFATLINDARTTSAEEIGPDDDARTFYRLSVPKRLVVMTGGPLMNLGLAAILFTLVFSVIGVTVADNAVGRVIECVPTATNQDGASTLAGCTDSVPTPASTLGLKSGDRFISINGVSTPTYEKVVKTLRSLSIGESVTLVVETEGQQKTLTTTMADAVFAEYGPDGKPTGTYRHSPMLGFVPAAKLEPLPIGDVPPIMWNIATESGKALIAFPQKLWALAQGMIKGETRDPTGPISVVGVSRISGEVVASDLSVPMKIQQVLAMVASLNLFLFLFNLLPLLPLDGGHAAGAMYEGIRRKFARLRGKQDPGPVDIARALPLTYIVSGILLLSGLLVIVADFVAPISYGN
jgi:membrane-associated protease RseP (regulator of RpoE activity)